MLYLQKTILNYFVFVLNVLIFATGADKHIVS